MGRTQRKRKKRQIPREREFSKVTQLQRALRLKCPKIEINYFDDIGWGMKCKKKINEGDVLIALPLRYLITPGVDCDIFNILRIKTQSPQFILSIFVNYESHLKEKSRYFEYIESLPKSFTNPYFCTENEINLLPEFIRKEIITQIKFINCKFEELFHIISDKSCPHCGEELKNIFTHEKFVWAWLIVNTRSVFYQNEKEAKSLALAPFLDLFNHSNEAVTELSIDFESGLYILRTLVSYRKFEQVFIKYGAHNNLKLFLEYGFTLPVNSDDFIEFSFEEVLQGVREFDFSNGEITKLKYNFIKSNKLNQDLIKSSEFSWNFQGLVYVLITKDQDLSKLQSKTYSSSFTSYEKNAIDKIAEIISKKKSDELNQILVQMEEIKNCTTSFNIVKNLIKNYINLLM